jgi:hypothetical protein
MGRQKKATRIAYEVKISENALQNIDEITGYIAFINQQPLNAIKVCEELASATKVYRKAACLSWSIIFKISVPEITILGIIHTSRKPSKIKALRKVK